MKTPVFPNIQLYIDNAGRLCIASTRRSDHEPFVSFEMPLSEVMQDGLDAAAQRLGTSLLYQLSVLYPGMLDLPPIEVPPPDLGNVHDLLRLSVQQRTSRFVPMIDKLLAEGRDEQFARESWPTLRDYLVTLPSEA
ncbi:hypothetical protein [Massilia endophytica]|uniref:hypothetical protein n=1 Tax=Massilia endophytica TaxID=2899220 RepID=UPI001E577A01|nr:hypothetical protein [Massilia endophytica]UGQ48851.1 hypothetical protein LSQ66_10430 [Massilia endophytica]